MSARGEREGGGHKVQGSRHKAQAKPICFARRRRITIVDGGKNKKTPPWARFVCNFCIGFSYFGEVVGGLAEYRTGEAVTYSGALDGRVTSSKYIVAVLNCLVIAVLCFANQQLGEGGVDDGSSGRVELR